MELTEDGPLKLKVVHVYAMNREEFAAWLETVRGRDSFFGLGCDTNVYTPFGIFEMKTKYDGTFRFCNAVVILPGFAMIAAPRDLEAIASKPRWELPA